RCRALYGHQRRAQHGPADRPGHQSGRSLLLDQSAETRQWADRFYKVAGRMPSGVQASNYAATLHYLKAIQAAGTDEAGAVVRKMRETKINDLMTKDGYIREDGRVMRDLYL